MDYSLQARHLQASFSPIAPHQGHAWEIESVGTTFLTFLLYAQFKQLKKRLRRPMLTIRLICGLRRFANQPRWLVNKASNPRARQMKTAYQPTSALLAALYCASLLSPGYAIAQSDGSTSGSPEVSFAFPRPFETTYTADYRGLPISATGIRTLKREKEAENQRYIFSSRAVSLFAKLDEASTFELENNQLIPARYQYQRTGLGKNKTLDMRFDWASGLAKDVAQDESFTFNPSTLFSDRLLYQLRLQVDLINTSLETIRSKTWTYPIFDKGRMKEYVFEVADEESIETALGKIHTVRLERKNEDSSRRTTLWLAPSLEYMLIRFVQEDDGDSFSLELKEAVLDGRAVRLDE